MSGQISGRTTVSHRFGRARRAIARKPKPEGGAVTGAALDCNRASVLFKNAAAHSESKSGTPRTGAESRVENARQIVRRNARPGVAHHDFHALALGARWRCDAANREPAATRHEAKSVEREVEQNLFEPVPVGRNANASETVDDLHFDPGLFGERQEKVVGPVEQLARVGWCELGLRRVVQVQHIVDRSGKRAQTRLQVEFPKTHEIERLLSLLSTVNREAAGAFSGTEWLSPFGAEIRYPGDAAEMLPGDEVKALEDARRAKEVVLRIVNAE